MTKVRVTRIKSAIDFEKDQKDTVRALRLGKLHRQEVFEATPQVMGMIRKIRHLVKFELFEEENGK